MQAKLTNKFQSKFNGELKKTRTKSRIDWCMQSACEYCNVAEHCISHSEQGCLARSKKVVKCKLSKKRNKNRHRGDTEDKCSKFQLLRKESVGLKPRNHVTCKQLHTTSTRQLQVNGRGNQGVVTMETRPPGASFQPAISNRNA